MTFLAVMGLGLVAAAAIVVFALLVNFLMEITDGWIMLAPIPFIIVFLLGYAFYLLITGAPPQF